MYQIQAYSRWNRCWSTIVVTGKARTAFDTVAIKSRENPHTAYRVVAKGRTLCEYYGGDEVSYNMLVA